MSHNKFKFRPDHLFHIFSREDIKIWITQLKYFTFYRATGGLANDPDQLLVSLRYYSYEDLVQLCKVFSINLEELDECAIEHLKSDKLPKYFYLGQQTLYGYKWALSLSQKEYLTITPVNGDPYEVCNEDFNACVLFEERLEETKLTSRVAKDTRQSSQAITWEKYGTLFD